jgi:glucose-6-phosphate 1-dehydrogenase
MKTVCCGCSSICAISVGHKAAGTFTQVRQQFGAARHALHYLAIPPALFGKVIGQLKASGCAGNGRVLVEKPARAR